MQEKVQIKKTFTQEEIAMLGKELSDVEIKKAEEVAEKKTVASQYKTRIDLLDVRIHQLSEDINTGWILEDVLCNVVFDKKQKQRKYYDINSGELLKEEPFKKEDYQEQIEFVAAPITSVKDSELY